MTKPFQRLRRFLAELKRRNVYQVAATYAVVGFVLIQVADLTFVRLGLPSWTVTLVIVLVAMGFPLALVLAWAFERTPEGMRRTADTEPPDEVAADGDFQNGYKILVGLGLVASALIVGWYLTGGGRTGPEISEQTVAVLPFQVSGSGAETWRDGIVTVLSTKLDGAAGLRAIPDRTVLAASEERRAVRKGASIEEALSVARGVGAEFAVVGSAVQLGQKLQFTADIHDVRSGGRVDRVEVAGAPDSVSALTDSLARRALGVLAGQMEGVQAGSTASLTTQSLPALRSYLRGERHFRAGDYGEATEDYEVAIRSDSTFVLPWTRLQSARWWSAQYQGVFPAIEKARRMSDRLPRRERRIVRARYLWVPTRRHLAARDSVRHLTKAYPDDPSVWYWLGEVTYHGSVPGGWFEAEDALDRAIEFDPGVPMYHHHFVELAFVLHHDSALAARRIADHPPGDHRQMYRLALRLVFGGDEAREEVLEQIDSLPVPTLYQLANSLRYPTDGRLEERVLRRILDREDLRRSGYQHRRLRNTFGRGRMSRALAATQELEAVSGAAEEMQLLRPSCYLALSMSLEMPVPDTVASGRLDPESIPAGAPAHRFMCAGFYLVERGREDELPGLIRRIRRTGSKQKHRKEKIEAVVNEVKGYAAWRTGRLDRAIRFWSETDEAGVWGAIWRGDLYLDRDQTEKARQWYYAAWRHPVAHERLGRLYEETGEPEKAASAYRRFIAAWKDADRELQPRVEAARERLNALTGNEPRSNG